MPFYDGEMLPPSEGGGGGSISPYLLLTPINAGLPHLARVCRYRARVHRLPACCCRLVAWHGAELKRDGIRKASLHYGTADRRYGTADRRYGTADRRYGTADRRYGTTDLR